MQGLIAALLGATRGEHGIAFWADLGSCPSDPGTRLIPQLPQVVRCPTRRLTPVTMVFRKYSHLREIPPIVVKDREMVEGSDFGTPAAGRSLQSVGLWYPRWPEVHSKATRAERSNIEKQPIQVIFVLSSWAGTTRFGLRYPFGQ
jgi:hypothetical protein